MAVAQQSAVFSNASLIRASGNPAAIGSEDRGGSRRGARTGLIDMELWGREDLDLRGPE
jgi:hypothetical protein